MGIYWLLEEQMLAARGEVLLERLPAAGRGCRLGRESGGWQRSGGEVLLLGRPLEIFLGGCSCIEGRSFGEILEGQAGYSGTFGRSKLEQRALERRSKRNRGSFWRRTREHGFDRDSRDLLLKRSIFRYCHCGFPISFYWYTFLFCFC